MTGRSEPVEDPLPVTAAASAREAIHFADLFGDSGQHLVRIRDGSVECWPNLGYGRFGPKVDIGNAPRFDGGMDASRLFLTDIDGSGTTDLVYTCPDSVHIYRNESGNRFSDKVSIPLPRAWNEPRQISFADVLGNGTACLVFTSVKDDLSLDHQYCDFTGGAKPHLLTLVDNNMGATTQIWYCPSTKFYLTPKEVLDRIDLTLCTSDTVSPTSSPNPSTLACDRADKSQHRVRATTVAA